MPPCKAKAEETESGKDHNKERGEDAHKCGMRGIGGERSAADGALPA